MIPRHLQQLTPRLLLFSFSLLLAASAASPAVPFQQLDPIVGKWCGHWTDGGPLVYDFNPNGTCRASSGITGTWKLTSADDQTRKYEISWLDGTSVDDIALSSDGQKYTGKHQDPNIDVWAERVPKPDPHDPLIGVWQASWTGGGPVTDQFHDDGTMQSVGGGGGTWKLTSSDNQERHYELVWPNGTDTVTLSADGQTYKGTSSVNIDVWAQRVKKASAKNSSDPAPSTSGTTTAS